MAADFSLLKGASRVIMIDSNWRLDFVKEKYPRVETIDFSTLPKGTSVYTKLRELVPRGPDVALECVAGEYPKGWAHYFEVRPICHLFRQCKWLKTCTNSQTRSCWVLKPTPLKLSTR